MTSLAPNFEHSTRAVSIEHALLSIQSSSNMARPLQIGRARKAHKSCKFTIFAHGSEDDERLTVGSLEALAEKAKRNAPHLAGGKLKFRLGLRLLAVAAVVCLVIEINMTMIIRS